jgi:hypothetical protein
MTTGAVDGVWDFSTGREIKAGRERKELGLGVSTRLRRTKDELLLGVLRAW